MILNLIEVLLNIIILSNSLKSIAALNYDEVNCKRESKVFAGADGVHSFDF